MTEQEKVWDAIYDLFERVLDECGDELLYLMSSDRAEKVNLSAPKFLIDKFSEACNYKVAQFSGQDGRLGKAMMFRGVKIIPSCEMAVTLFHEDYPMLNDSKELVYKISLMPAQINQHEWYREHVVSFMQFFNFGDGKHHLN